MLKYTTCPVVAKGEIVIKDYMMTLHIQTAEAEVRPRDPLPRRS